MSGPLVQVDGGSPQDPAPPPGRHRLGVVLAVGALGLLAGLAIGSSPDVSSNPSRVSDEQSPVTTPTSPTSLATATTATSLLPSTTTAPQAGDVRPLRGRVELLPGASKALGFTALSVGGVSEIGANLWVLQPGGRLVQRVDVPLSPGGFEHPMLIAGDYLLFTSPEGAYRLDLELARPAERIEEEALLLPDSEGDRLWIVGCCEPKWFAPFDGREGEIGERTSIEAGFGWPLVGFDGGLLFQAADTATYGPLAHWSTADTPQPFGLEMTSQTGLHAVTARLAVLVSPGPVLTVVDLVTKEEVARFSFESEGGNVSGVCVSPDGRHVAAVSSTGPLEVWEVSTGNTVGRMMTSASLWTTGWTTPNQLAFINESQNRTRLTIFDVESLSSFDVAFLTAPGIWRIATSGSTC